jgi:hypothetical protein
MSSREINESDSFMNNPNLKQVGVKIQMTVDQAVEYVLCANDPIYFITKYLKVISLDHGEVPFELYEYQKGFIETIHQNRFVLARWARQMGKSTTCAAYFVWYMIFNKKKFISIMANKAEIAFEILYRVKEMYESVPIWLQQGVKRWNVKSIGLENGSRILASATTPSAIRGKSVNILFIDEVAHIPKKLWDQFYLSSYPTLTSGDTTQMIFVSTPKGLNHFYEFYVGSPANGFVISDATWELHPNRDEEWKKITLGKMTVEQFAQEMECSFIGSSYSLINPGTLTTLKAEDPIEIAEGLWVFEAPIKDQNYCITADVSEGLAQDHSTFHVFKLTDMKNGMLEEVASFQDNRMDPITFASTLYRIGTYYNTAPILVEANDVGRQVVRYLKIDLEYEKVIRTRQEIDPARPSADKSRDYGLRVNKRTKRIGCINFKLFLEKGKFKLKCARTIEELKHFVRPPEVAEKEGTFKAEDGYHDDLVMPLVNLSFIFGTKHFENAFETKSLLEMFKESVSDRSDIAKALSEIHVPIISTRPSTGGMISISETFSVRPRGVEYLERHEREWFAKG